LLKSYLIAAVVAIAAIIVVAGVALSGVLNPTATTKTIKYLDVAPVNQQAYIQSGQIDGGVSWEPYCSDSITNGTGHALLWSGDIWPDHPCCVVAMDQTFINSDRNAALAVLKAHIEANNWIVETVANKNTTEGQANYSFLLTLGASFSNRNTTVVASALEHMTIEYDLTAAQENYFKNFTNSYVSSNLIKASDVPDVDAFVNGLVDTSLLAEVSSVTPVASGSPLTTVRIGYLNGDLHQFSRVVAMSAEVGSLLGLGDRSVFAAYGINAVAPSAMPGSGYANGGAVMTGFAGNDMDVGYLGAPPTILNVANQKLDVSIVALANTEGSALIVNNDIKSIDELDGTTIGEPGISSIQYLLLLEIADRYGYEVVKS